ncbi:hypothetical protein AAHC03_09398 [Spirometra sp. Aus1]
MEAFIEIYPDMNANLLANVTRITIEKVRRIRGYDEEVDTVDDRLSDSVNPTSAEQSMQNASGKQSRPKKSPRKSCSNSTAEGVFVFPPRSATGVEPVGVETVPEVNATPALCGSQLASTGSPITRSLSEPHLTHVDHHVPVQKLVGLSISGNEHGRGQQVLSYSAPEITADATCKGCVRCPTTAAWAPPTELRLCQPMTH